MHIQLSKVKLSKVVKMRSKRKHPKHTMFNVQCIRNTVRPGGCGRSYTLLTKEGLQIVAHSHHYLWMENKIFLRSISIYKTFDISIRYWYKTDQFLSSFKDGLTAFKMRWKLVRRYRWLNIHNFLILNHFNIKIK